MVLSVHVFSSIIPCIVSSAGEAEYAALFAGGQHAASLRTIVADLGHPSPRPLSCAITPVPFRTSRTIYNLLYKNRIQHGRLLHKESGPTTTQIFYTIRGKVYNLTIEAEGVLK
jgi:hypothetical protein